MHCPKCGQQQPSDSVRFCSRCGFHLGVVGELLLTNGVLPGSETSISPRRQGVILGTKLLFVSVVLLPVAILLSFAADSPAFLIAPAAAFFLGLVRMLYALAFEESLFTASTREPAPPLPRKSKAALETGETPPQVPQDSVTEQTTHILNED